jgi:excinuclease ABC subunit C
MPEGVGNDLVTAPVRRAARRARQPAPESFDPRRGPGGIDVAPAAAELEGPAEEKRAGGGIANGAAVIRTALKNVPARPGVYRMLDRKGDAIYVGKARNLKARVQNYTHPLGLANRTRRMVAETAALEIVVTQTEAEALLLECNMIKRLLPRFNVLLRDDKSFPLIHITAGHEFPQLTKHRGARADDGVYFGPFASAGAVNRTLITLQKAFLLRSCSDSVFNNRTRPCLLFQIKRCSAPCVGRIAPEHYAALIEEAKGFLNGRSADVQARLAVEMEAASTALDFEAAAMLRDRIRALSMVQGHQDIYTPGVEDADVIAAHQAGGHTCVQVFFFRGGQNWGNRAYFPSHDRQLSVEEVLTSFVGQFYDNRPKPPLVMLSHKLVEQALVEEALSLGGRKVTIQVPQRGDKKKLIDRIVATAREALGRRLAESSTQRQLLDGVAAALGLPGPLNRIEVYDNSHNQGSNAVGAMIVAGPEGLMKNQYRKFTIRGERTAEATPRLEEPTETPDGIGGDDYAMMREVLHRRFARAIKEDPDRASGAWPDLVLIDGGLGQLGIAQGVLDELGIGDVPVIGIAKGPDRNAGRERFFVPGRPSFSLEPRDPVLYFLQRLRDEAHRFAIGTYRARHAKSLGQSPLDEIPGIGARRKQALLHHFGSARSVARAGLAEIERIAGISKTVAKKVYDHFHGVG